MVDPDDLVEQLNALGAGEVVSISVDSADEALLGVRSGGASQRFYLLPGWFSPTEGAAGVKHFVALLPLGHRLWHEPTMLRLLGTQPLFALDEEFDLLGMPPHRELVSPFLLGEYDLGSEEPMLLIDTEVAALDNVVTAGAVATQLIRCPGAVLAALPNAQVLDLIGRGTTPLRDEPGVENTADIPELLELASDIVNEHKDRIGNRVHRVDELLIAAAERGSIDAMDRLWYRVKAFESEEAGEVWLRRAAEAGSPPHLQFLGRRLVDREALESSKPAEVADAEQILLAGARAGVKRSMSALADFYFTANRGDDGSDESAAHWLRILATEDDDSAAANQLGIIRYYQDRRNVSDDDDALHWYRVAHQLGATEAPAFNIGEVMEESGQLDGEDGALAWYRLAAQEGSESAREALKRLES